MALRQCVADRGVVRRLVSVVMAFGLVVATLAISLSPASATFPGTNGRIAFIEAAGGTFDIYTMNPDGTSVRRLTNNTTSDLSPRWSPDGKEILYFGQPSSSNGDVYVMNADGTGTVNLTSSVRFDADPGWSPDGKKIAWLSDAGSGGLNQNLQIFVMNADGSGRTQITNFNTGGNGISAGGFSLDWSTTGRIVWGSVFDGVQVMDASGTGLTQLDADGLLPKWSPDGSSIVFTGGDITVTRMGANGAGKVSLGVAGSAPSFSPDGSKIVYHNGTAPDRRIFVMNADGSNSSEIRRGVLFEADWGTSPLVSDGTSRLAGSNRFGTAAAISASQFAPGVDVVYLATGANFPDALAGGPIAGINGGPILLAGSIPADTAAELTRLKPGKIVILGGTGVVSDADAIRLKAYTTGPVERLAGANRYATAAAISASQFSPGVDVAYVATGANFPDALAGGPVAALNGGPILLTASDAIPGPTAAELTRLAPKRIVVLGGTGVVSSAVETRLGSFTKGSVGRLAGPNRFATAAAISASQFSPGVEVVFIATAANFPDALAGSPVAAIKGGPILLVNKDNIPGPTQTELNRLKPKSIVVLGGTGVVDPAVKVLLAGFVK